MVSWPKASTKISFSLARISASASSLPWQIDFPLGDVWPGDWDNQPVRTKHELSLNLQSKLIQSYGFHFAHIFTFVSHSNTVHICTSRNHHLGGLKRLPPPSEIVGRLGVSRRFVRKTICQDDISSGWMDNLGRFVRTMPDDLGRFVRTESC